MKPIDFNLKKHKSKKIQDFAIKQCFVCLLFFCFSMLMFANGINIETNLKNMTIHQDKLYEYGFTPCSGKCYKGDKCTIRLNSETIYANYCYNHFKIVQNYGETIKVYTKKELFIDRERIYKISVIKNGREIDIKEFSRNLVMFDKLYSLFFAGLFFFLALSQFKILKKKLREF